MEGVSDCNISGGQILFKLVQNADLDIHTMIESLIALLTTRISLEIQAALN